jgi:HD-GYP domain-containing protein (c-di-GMP phosphodiesterase class II)
MAPIHFSKTQDSFDVRSLLMTDELDIVKSIQSRRNRINITLAISTLILGITIDFFIFTQETVTTAYVPFMLMVGYLSRFLITNLIIACMTTMLLQLNPGEEGLSELFFLRWGGYFLIALLIKSMMANNQKEQENLISFITTLSSSIDARDPYTSFHSQNVAYYSREIGKAMNLSKKDCDHLYLGGLLHDFGKIGISEKILNKTTDLTDEEYEQIKLHPQKGYDMLKHIAYFRGNCILEMVLHHHERYDGKGYPHGLKGENISRVARIMAVADAFDAMTSKRIYRDMKGLEYAINQLERGKQGQFDPKIVDVFLQLIISNKIIIRGMDFNSVENKVSLIDS